MPRISIVTLSYNQRRYLDRAVESVLMQGWADLEYIVVDPGSTDGSREFLANRLEGVPGHLLFQPDHGPAEGLNKGFRMATGDLIGYLNADDAYLPDTFQRVVEAFRRHQEATVVYGDGLRSAASKLRPVRSTQFRLRRYAYGMSIVLQQATFFRRRNIGTMLFNEANRTCWDAEFLVDIALSGAKLVHVPETWGLFEVHAESITGSGRLLKQYRADHRRIAEKILDRPWRTADEWTLQSMRLFLRARNALILLSREARLNTSPPGSSGGSRRCES